MRKRSHFKFKFDKIESAYFPHYRVSSLQLETKSEFPTLHNCDSNVIRSVKPNHFEVTTGQIKTSVFKIIMDVNLREGWATDHWPRSSMIPFQPSVPRAISNFS